MLDDPNDPTGPVAPDEGTLDDPLATPENTAPKTDDVKVPGDTKPERPDPNEADGEPAAGTEADQ